MIVSESSGRAVRIVRLHRRAATVTRSVRSAPPKQKTRQWMLAGFVCLSSDALGNQLAGVAGFSCLAPPRNSSHQLGPSARLWSPRRRIERMT